jgi:PAS domain S-box-containing protein
MAVAFTLSMLEQGTDIYELVVDSLNDHAVILLDSDESVLRWSKGAERITGYDSDSVVGQRFSSLDLPIGASTRADALKEAREHGSYHHEGWWERPDGKRFWIDEVMAPLIDHGELIGFVDIARDRTADKLSADESHDDHVENGDDQAGFLDEATSILAAASINFDSAVRSLARLSISRFADWCVIYALQPNRTLKAVEGAHRDPENQRALERMLDRAVEPGAEHPLSKVMRTGDSVLIETVNSEQLSALVLKDTDGAMIRKLGMTSVMFTPLVARGRVVGVLMAASSEPGRHFAVEELKLAEELGRRAGVAIDNARLYREAQDANRSKADFLAIVSHELRTPLNAIMGYSDILDAGISGEVSENQRRQIARIRTSARHLTQIIEEILSYARLESGGLEIEADFTTIGTLAEEAVAIAEPVAVGKGLKIDTVLSDPDQTLVTDSSKARQVLLNLLSNAIKFTERGKVELRTFMEGDKAVYMIRDTGMGMSSDQIERIFDPFWQIERPTTRRAGGTGLGLSVARRFAHLLGGTITVESTRNLGSTFTLRLPLAPTATESKKRG